MPLSNDELETLIYGSGPGRRFTQDSPVMPDVWLEYGRTSDRVDLLLTPQIGTSTAALAQFVNAEASSARVASSDTYVVAALTFEELVRIVLPLTYWRREQILDPSRAAPQIKWLTAVVERILAARRVKAPKKAAAKLLDEQPRLNAEDDETPLVWQVSRNRPAELAIWASRPAVKADAAVQLFSIDCGSIALGGDRLRHRRAAPRTSKRGDDGNLPERRPGARANPGRRNLRLHEAAYASRARRPAGHDPLGLRPHHRADPSATTSRAAARSTGPCCCASAPRPARPGPRTRRRRIEHGTHVAGILAGDWRPGRPAVPETRTRPRRRARTSSSTTCACSTTRRRRRVRRDGRAPVRPLPERDKRLAGHPRREPQPLDPARRRQLRVRAHAGLRRVRAAGRQPAWWSSRRPATRATREYTTACRASPEGYRSISITDPGNADGRHHRRRHAPLPAAHLRRQLLLQPRADRRRADQARPGRAGREDHRAGARTRARRASTARAWPRRTSAAPRRC